MNLSLSRIKALCKKLQNPEKNLKVISVVGTNGKNGTIQAMRSILNEAKINLKQIENLAGLSTRNDDYKALLEEPTKDDLSIFIGELRTLTEKRSQIKDSLHKVDNELIKLQEKIYKNKKIYEDKIAQLETINEIYSQSANIVSKIISEDTKYEQL